MDSIYGSYGPALQAALEDIIGRIRAYSDDIKAKTGEAAYEHLIYRIKSEGSMREKCDRKGLPQTAYRLSTISAMPSASVSSVVSSTTSIGLSTS